MMDNRFRLFLIALFLLSMASLGLAQPTTPPVYINRKHSLVQLAKSQRATLTYDLRSIGGQHLKVKMYRHDQTFDQEPVKEWLFHGETNEIRLDFREFPINMYTLLAYCSDENGEALAYAAPFIFVEYGGWRAWEKFKPPVETVKNPPEAFPEVETATNIANRDVGLHLDPPAAVIKPGGVVIFNSFFRNMETEEVNWKLVGEGTLKNGDDGSYIYTAPPQQVGTKLFRVEIQSVAHPELQAVGTILVTSADNSRVGE